MMKFMRVVVCFLVCAATVAAAGVAWADPIPALSFSANGSSYSAAYVVGATLTPNVDVVLTHLGVIDGDTNGLEGDAYVGLYEWNLPMITSVTIPAATSGESLGSVSFQAYYVDVPDVTLLAGHHYLVASRSADYRFLPVHSGYAPASQLTYDQFDVWDEETQQTITREDGQGFKIANLPSGQTLPATWTKAWAPNSGSPYFGGTFKFEVVPEPATLWLLLTGVLCLAARQRRG